MNENFNENLIVDQLLKAKDISKILNISRSMAYRLLDEGIIPSIRINQAVRVHPKDLANFIDANRMAAHKDL
jgi:predicted DNA-binding transcriptional regulator AlpA